MKTTVHNVALLAAVAWASCPWTALRAALVRLNSTPSNRTGETPVPLSAG